MPVLDNICANILCYVRALIKTNISFCCAFCSVLEVITKIIIIMLNTFNNSITFHIIIVQYKYKRNYTVIDTIILSS